MQRDPYKYFRIEAKELLEGLTAGVLDLERGASGAEVVPRLLRFAHTLKGAARVVKQPGIAELAHRLEDTLTPHRESVAVAAAAARAAALIVDEASAQLQTLGGAKATDVPAPPAVASGKTAVAIVAPVVAPVAPVLAPGPKQLGIAETVRIEIAEMDAVLDNLSEVSVQVGGLRQAFSAFAEAQRLSRILLDQLTLRKAADKDVLTFDQRLARARSTLEEVTTCLDKNQRHFGNVFERVERDLAQVRDQASQLRLLPTHTIFAPLDRAAHDAAATLDRAVTFHTRGGDGKLEAHVLGAVRNALLHVVRNAVAHGIESTVDRQRAGKPGSGRIDLEVERRGDYVVFACRDDGRGIDVDRIRAIAVERRLLSTEEARSKSDNELTRLIFSPGFTTASAVDAVSGRGVGMDVVQQIATELKGEVSVKTERGRSTTVEIRVPISLSSVQALAVIHDAAKVWVPLEAVVHTLHVRAADVARQSSGDAIVYDGVAIPFVAMASLLPSRQAVTARAAWSAVIVRAEGRTMALGVDKLLDVARVIVRTLPKTSPHAALVSGAAFDSEGDPELVLDPTALVRASDHAKGRVQEPAARAARLPVLVVDDSLTTRMLEQSILEAAGYEVDLAVSAEEGLAKAAARRYGLFLCDVEMPGMNGFDFVARTKADPKLKDIPSILVTSLSSPEDRRRGMEVGAYAYIVKGEYDEGLLKQLIQTLVG